MNEWRRAARDAVIREYLRLGCRITEVVNLLGEPRATVQRAVKGLRDPSSDRVRSALPGLHQRLLAAFWYEFQGRHGVNPPPPGPELLRGFCELCRAPRPENGRRRARPVVDRLLNLSSAVHGVEGVFAAAALLCAEDPDPDECLAGPARFALFCAGLRRDPWTAALFLSQHVSHRRVWVRRCSRCEEPFVSQAPGQNDCGCESSRHGASRLRARLARTGLSLLR